MKTKNQKKPLLIFYKILLLILFLAGGFFRFYNLDWGSPYYFHPDERQNIAYPILNSHSSLLLDQKNFDIGTFPLIVIKNLYPIIGGVLYQKVDSFAQIIVTERFINALLSLLTAVLVYRISKKYFGTLTSLIAFTLMLFFPGNIQYSHFGTVETWEAFFLTILFFYSIKISKNNHLRDYCIAGIVTGFATSTKLLTLLAVPTILFATLFSFYTSCISVRHFKIKLIYTYLLGVLLYVLFSGVIFLLLTPQIIFHFLDIKDSIQFESKVAIGTLPVFYTQSFYKTIPYLFQLEKVFPFLIGPVGALFLVPSVLYTLYTGFKKNLPSFLLASLFFLATFIPQGYFLAKWSRYYVMCLPFAAICIGAFLTFLYSYFRTFKYVTVSLIVFVLCATCIYSAAFFITVYMETQTPVEASHFAEKNIPQQARIITEPFDLGIQPFQAGHPNISFFDFYSVDENPVLKAQLKDTLQTTDYIILPSQRVIRSRAQNPQKFPMSAAFYNNLLQGKDWKKIYETPCNILCKITYLNDPIFSFEETASVFDRPTVMIFKKL